MLIYFIFVFTSCLNSQSLNFPKQYFSKFTIEVPQWKESGYDELVEPVSVYYDGLNGQERLEFWNATDISIVTTTTICIVEGYYIYPRLDTVVCNYAITDTFFGLASAFPFKLNEFKYQGRKMINGSKGPVLCQEWFRYDPILGSTNNYTFYVTVVDQTPVLYKYIGSSGTLVGFQDDPNYDWFLVHYIDYIPNYYNASVFNVPSICDLTAAKKHKKEREDKQVKKENFHQTPISKLQHLLPIDGEDLYKEFLLQHGKGSKMTKESKKNFLKNQAFINHHNRKHALKKESYTLKMNHLGTEDHSIMSMRKGRGYIPYKKKPEDFSKEKHYTAKLKKEELPINFDWRSKGAVSPMKDQGDCGSCWSFASTAALESAYYIKHGKMELLSEQYLLDCSWPMGNNACDGGSSVGAYEFLLGGKGGIPTEHQYRYRMNMDFCRNNTAKSQVNITNWQFVHGEENVMDALVNIGPIAAMVSTFPAQSWTFYHSGIYNDNYCLEVIPDHQVLLVGYGTDNSTGQKYWILKNQWSQYWGENGYMRIQRDWNDCGVIFFGNIPYVE